ncbi:hypothetical protein EUTSA_v10009475mg [Eutrema salsugineum]|uniref:DUF4283 domain-containing protein n=1 Tax=Eutrema salsugineum TaxID=72664 RepID=V4KUN4_EUTSA|nr:hypothetical protein EUTSA_v10009475mg [Eutrema salsugineum]
MLRKKKKRDRPKVVSTSKFARVASIASIAAAVKKTQARLEAETSVELSLTADGETDPLLTEVSTDLVPDPSLGTVAAPDLSPIVDSTPATQMSSLPIQGTVEGSSSSTVTPPSIPDAPPPALPSMTKKNTYSSLLQDPRRLEAIGSPSQHELGVPFVFIPDDNIAAAKEEFKEFIFARFHGEYPSMERVIGVVNAIWARPGPCIIVHNLGEGTFLLRVSSPKITSHILSRNLWSIAGFPMFVAPWSPNFNPDEPPLTSAVVPVEFREVPYLLFNKVSLSRIATAVGTPVALSPETERKETFEVAKVYVRVNLLQELPTRIVSGFSNSREVLIKVSYP